MIIYEGPSQIDRSPIVAILTGHDTPSVNKKTGPMAQVWILCRDTHPVEAAKSGDDIGACGGCIHRKLNLDTCYVTLAHGPAAVWRKYKAGGYPHVAGIEWPAGAAPNRILHRHPRVKGVRFGAYGDPMALPIEVIEQVASWFEFWTGYTHQWRRRGSEAYAPFCMASIELAHQAPQAWKRGFRTFSTDPGTADSIECPADPAAGITCDTCKACGGDSSASGFVSGIWIDPHGRGSQRVEEYTRTHGKRPEPIEASGT